MRQNGRDIPDRFDIRIKQTPFAREVDFAQQRTEGVWYYFRENPISVGFPSFFAAYGKKIHPFLRFCTV